MHLARPLIIILGVTCATAWEFPQKPVFPPGQNSIPNVNDNIDIVTGSQFNGLATYANLPYLNCLSDSEAEGKKYDIAILGAPFDTVSIYSILTYLPT